MSCGPGVIFGRGAALAAVPVNLTLALSPSVTSQASPGAQVLTATPTGGTGTISYAWTATYVADGSSAAALLSGSGATRTITTTAPGQVVQVSVVATDSGSPTAQTATASASVSVAQPASPTLSGPAAQTMDAPGGGSVTFTGATGYPSLSYSAAFTAPAGSAATMSGSGLGPYTFTTDVEGAYVVTLTLTDGLGRNAVATGVVSLVSMGAIWTVQGTEDFTTYDTASRSGSGTVALQKAGATQYTATVNVNAGTWTAGINAGGLFITQSSGTGQGAIVFKPPITGTEWYAVQWVMDMPSFSNSTVTGRVTVMSSSTVMTGNEFFAAIFKNGATAGNFDITALIRMSGVGQTSGTFQSNGASPGRVCVSMVAKDGQIYYTVHDADDFVPMASVGSSIIGGVPLGPARNDTSSNQPSRWVADPWCGISLGASTGTVGCRKMRWMTAPQRVD